MKLSDVVNWIKLPPKYLVPIALVSSALLFFPEGVLKTLGVLELVSTYHMWIGLALLLSCALLITHFGAWLVRRVSQKLSDRRFLKSSREILKDLSPEEKTVLSMFILEQSKTQNLPIQSGVANGLEHVKIIYRSSNLGDLHSFAYNIQPWAWKALNAEPGLLEPELSLLRDELETRKTRR